MRRMIHLFLIGLMVAGAAYTFEVKRRADNATDKARQLTRQIEREKETIDLLETDLSVLAQPSRLQKLAERYDDSLQLKTLKVDQIITLDELPHRPVDLTPFQNEGALGGYAGGSETNIQ